jgi:hypothetical protein
MDSPSTRRASSDARCGFGIEALERDVTAVIRHSGADPRRNEFFDLGYDLGSLAFVDDILFGIVCETFEPASANIGAPKQNGP